MPQSQIFDLEGNNNCLGYPPDGFTPRGGKMRLVGEKFGVVLDLNGAVVHQYSPHSCGRRNRH